VTNTGPIPTSVDQFIRLRVRLIWPEVVAIQVCVMLAAILRGIDYLVPPAPATTVLSTIEKAAPVDLWGTLFVIGGMVGLVGLRITRWPLAALGHVILLACYAAFAMGSFVDMLSRSGLEGWRSPADWALVFSVIHWGFADASLDVWKEEKERRDAS
jgi:hypothetical protein